MPRWTLGPGRALIDGRHRDGGFCTTVANVARAGTPTAGYPLSPGEVDDLARTIVDGLNLATPGAARLLTTPPAEWHKALPRDLECIDLSRELDSLIEHAARLRAYLDHMAQMRRDDDAHAAAVKASNNLAAKIRKALGYTQARNDYTF